MTTDELNALQERIAGCIQYAEEHGGAAWIFCPELSKGAGLVPVTKHWVENHYPGWTAEYDAFTLYVHPPKGA